MRSPRSRGWVPPPLCAALLLIALLPAVSLLGPGPARAEPPPAARFGSLGAREPALLERLVAEVEAAAAARDAEALQAFFPEVDLGRWSAAVFEGAESPVTLQISPRYPRADGELASVRLFVARMRGGGYGAYELGAQLVREEQGQLVVRAAPPLSQTLRAVEAEVRLHPAEEWIEVDARLEIEGDTSVLPLQLGARTAAGGGWARIRSVTQDGQPCDFATTDEGLVVVPVAPAERLTLEVRYVGEYPASAGQFLRADEVLLRGADSRWLPLLADTRATFDVTIDHPVDFAIRAQGERQDLRTRRGRARARFQHRGGGFTVYGAPDYIDRRFSWLDARAVISVAPERAGLLPDLAAAVVRAGQALAPLGPYPAPAIRIVETGYHDGQAGYGAVGNIGLGWRTLDPLDEGFLRHELAHGWFGGLVQVAPEALLRGQWNESLAEYVSAWGLPEEQARARRAAWLARWQALENRRPISAVGTRSADWETHHAVSYAKGALLLCALEDRLGGRRDARAAGPLLRAPLRRGRHLGAVRRAAERSPRYLVPRQARRERRAPARLGLPPARGRHPAGGDRVGRRRHPGGGYRSRPAR